MPLGVRFGDLETRFLNISPKSPAFWISSLTAGSIYICTMNRLRIATRSTLRIYVKGTSPTLLESAFDTLSP